ALATHVSLGHGLPGEHQIDPQSVLIMSAEDGLGDTIGPRLDSMGADCEKILAISKPVVFDTAGCEAIDNLIGRKNARLIVIDPLFAYTGAKVDIHRVNESREVMTRIAALAEKHKCAIVCIRHLTKGGRDKSIYRGVGSIDFTAACRSALLVGADARDRNRRAVVQTKNNLATIADPIGYSLENGVFTWTGVSDLTAREILASDEQAGETMPIKEAEEFLAELLSTGPTHEREIKKSAKSAGISDRTLFRAKQNLKIKSRKISFGSDTWVWSLPETEGQ